MQATLCFSLAKSVGISDMFFGAFGEGINFEK
jgi:hypothetical protein